MRVVFSVVGLLLVVAVIGMVARKQLVAVAPAAPSQATGAPAPAVTPRDQVQAARVAAEAALQSPRPMPDDAK